MANDEAVLQSNEKPLNRLAVWSLVLGCTQAIITTVCIMIAFFIWSLDKTFPPDNTGHPIQWVLLLLLFSGAGIAGIVCGVKGLKYSQSQTGNMKLVYAGLLINTACIVASFIAPFTWHSPMG